MPTTVAMPASIGVMVPKASFNIVGRPQAIADFSVTRGVRISGSGLTNFRAFNGRIPDGNPQSFAGMLAIGPAGVNVPTWYVPMVPGNVDPRLYQIAKTFQFYAFRELTLTFVPSVGTSTVNNLAFGVSQESELYQEIQNPTQQQVLELNYATLTPMWQTASVSYRHSGTKTWMVNYEGRETGNVAQFYQAQIVAAANDAAPGGVLGQAVGNFFVTYVIDLYEPQPVPYNVAGIAFNPADGELGPPHCCPHPHSEDEKEHDLPGEPPVLARS